MISLILWRRQGATETKEGSDEVGCESKNAGPQISGRSDSPKGPQTGLESIYPRNGLHKKSFWGRGAHHSAVEAQDRMGSSGVESWAHKDKVSSLPGKTTTYGPASRTRRKQGTSHDPRPSHMELHKTRLDLG